MDRRKILITEPMPYVDEEIKILSKYGEIILANTTNHDILKNKVADVDIIMVVYAKITRDIIESASRLKGIVRYGIGVDNIDLDSATQHGVMVANVPDYGITTVAEFTVGLILALTRKIVFADRYMRSKSYLDKWTSPPLFLRGIDLEGKTVGIIGLGRIGREVAKRLKNFSIKLLGYDPYVTEDMVSGLDIKLVDLDTLLENSDIITIHVSLTKETHHLIDENKFRKMKDGVFIVNTSRGPVIDEKALIQNLKTNKIAGCALDVYEIEPLPIDSDLFMFDNIILTPHIAWYTEEAVKRLEFTAVEEAIRILRGEIPKNLVNRGVIGKR